ncbi:MAG: hypothetical protein ACREOG_03315 [Gemmatimonadaceae bacterium]
MGDRPMSFVRLLSSLALLVSAVPVHAQQIRDSAGLRVVLYPLNASAPRTWVLDRTPVTEANEATLPESAVLHNVKGVSRLSDGRIVVANGGSSELLFLSPKGDLLQRVGRRGGGPGEFSRVLWSVFSTHDTVVASDNDGRAQVFGPDGHLLRSLNRPRILGATGPATRAGALTTGAVVLYAQEDTPASDTGVAQYVIASEGPDGNIVAMEPRVGAYRRFKRTGSAVSGEVYGPTGKVAAGADRICAGFTDRFRITCFASTGKPAIVIERHVRTRSITEGDRSLFKNDMLESNRGAPAEALRRLEESLRLTTFAESAPRFGRLLIGRTGELWISEFSSAEELQLRSRPSTAGNVRWSAFGPKGEWLADLLVPSIIRPTEFGPDYMAGVAYGDYGVERAAVWRFVR